MKKQFILLVMSMLLFSTFGYSQGLENNFKFNDNYLEKNRIKDIPCRDLFLRIESNVDVETLVYFGDSDIRLVQPQNKKVEFFLNQENQLKLNSNFTDLSTFNNSVLSYPSLIEKNKGIKKEKLSDGISHGWNYWLDSN